MVTGTGSTLSVSNATFVGGDTVYGGVLHSHNSDSATATLRNVLLADAHADLGALFYHAHGDGLAGDVAYLHHDATSDDGELRTNPSSGSWTETDVSAATIAFVDTSAPLAADWDLHLASGSAAIDAGDPTILDADGSRSDLGAFGGPQAW